jgi:hypothetical protein
MRLYMAGNFPVMNDLNKERAMKDYVLKKGYPNYNRLVSFYHIKGAKNVIQIGKESREGCPEPDKDD